MKFSPEADVPEDEDMGLEAVEHEAPAEVETPIVSKLDKGPTWVRDPETGRLVRGTVDD